MRLECHDQWAQRFAISRLWYPGYHDEGEADFAACIAEDGWHMHTIGAGTFVQVAGEFLTAWDEPYDPTQFDGTKADG